MDLSGQLCLLTPHRYPSPQLGTYDPLPLRIDNTKEIRLQIDRIKYWLSVGAQPSDRVSYLLWRAGLTPAPPIRFTPTAWTPKKERKGAKAFHTLVEAVYGPYAGVALGGGSPLQGGGARREALPISAVFGGHFGGGLLLRARR